MKTPTVSKQAFDGLCTAMVAYEADDHTDDTDERVAEIEAANAWIRRVNRLNNAVPTLTIPSDAKMEELCRLRSALRDAIAIASTMRRCVAEGHPPLPQVVSGYETAIRKLAAAAVVALDIPKS